MKTILCILSILLSGSLSAFNPGWTVDPSAYSNSMILVGVLNVDYQESQDVNDVVAAFSGDEIRGVANVYFEATLGKYLAFLVVYSNTSDEVISFKAYDASEDKVVDIIYTTPFEVDGLIGDANSPIIWENLTPLGFNGILQIQVYPTVVSNYVMVVHPENQSTPVVLLSLDGTTLAEMEVDRVTGMDLSHLKTGVYLLRCQFGDAYSTYRLVKR